MCGMFLLSGAVEKIEIHNKVGGHSPNEHIDGLARVLTLRTDTRWIFCADQGFDSARAGGCSGNAHVGARPR
jgi:hypothetical protein